jgi:DNA-binding GntR family transcriptional regulator
MSAPPPNLLELRRGSTLSSLVAQEITRLIVDGTIPKGARLNESELAARFGVSRGPVREALRTIESDGLVVGIANRGVFVRDIDDRAASEIYDLRAALFAMAGWIVAPIATPELIARLKAIIATMQAAITARDLDSYYAANLAFHEAIVDATGNRRLKEQYDSLIQELHLYRRRSLVTPGRMVKSNAEHRAILDAIRRHDGDLAASRMRAHVLVSRDKLIPPRTTIPPEPECPNPDSSNPSRHTSQTSSPPPGPSPPTS